MKNLIKTVYLFSIVFWIGGMAFFTLIAAPILFSTLPIEEASKVVGAIFPYYYEMAYLFGFMALLSILILLKISPGRPKSIKIIPVLLGVMLALSLYAGEVVQPEMHTLKKTMNDSSKPLDETNRAGMRFTTLHNVSTALNGIVLLLGITTVFLTAVRLKD